MLAHLLAPAGGPGGELGGKRLTPLVHLPLPLVHPTLVVVVGGGEPLRCGAIARWTSRQRCTSGYGKAAMVALVAIATIGGTEEIGTVSHDIG